MRTSPAIAITIRNVSKRYRTGYAVKNVSTCFEAGRLNLLVGQNGSGKTTLLRCIMGLCRYEGSIERDNLKIGYAPEQYVMPAFMSMLDFLMLLGRLKETEGAKVRQVLREGIGIFGLEQFVNRQIGVLSNGMKQKINLLQAIVHDPDILIFDEPLQGLDAESQQRFIERIKTYARTKLVIISTHYPEKFRANAKKVYVIENGEMADAGDV